MKLKLPKLKIIHALNSLKYLYIVTLIIIIGFIAVLGYFLYKNFYQTITQAEEIILLKKEVAPEAIDTNKVDRVLEALEQKTTTTPSVVNLGDLKNPFASESTAAPEEELEPEE